MRGIAVACLLLAFCLQGTNAQAWKKNWVTGKTPAIIPAKAGVTTHALLNVGDGVPNTATPGATYRMVGAPDGMGVWRINATKFGVVMNHEFPTFAGTVRRHGATGAFVSKWLVDSKTLKVEGGEDLIQEVYLWNTATGAYEKNNAYAFGAFCSANLAPVNAFYDAATKTGTQDRIFMNGEEIGTNSGRAFAHVVTGAFAGKSYEIEKLGRSSFENVVAAPYTGTKTVIIGSDDSFPGFAPKSGGKLTVLYGTKQPCAAGDNPLKCAGLLDALRYYIRVPLIGDAEPGNFVLPNLDADKGYDFVLVGSVAESTAFLRPEDCHWDPEDRNTFYCATTAAFDQRTRLWKYVFTDATALAPSPAIAGKVYLLVDSDPLGPDASNPRMMDNIVAYNGGVVIQEDTGGNPYVARLWRYCNANKKLEVVATFDPAIFCGGPPPCLTIDEESSAIINLDIAVGYARNCFLLTAQIHRGIPDPVSPNGINELVQDGQLLVMCLPLSDVCPGATPGQRSCPKTT